MPESLSSLVYALNGAHEYQQALQTTQQVHALDHKRMANVHYVAAWAAMSLHDYEAMQHELTLFVSRRPY